MRRVVNVGAGGSYLLKPMRVFQVTQNVRFALHEPLNRAFRVNSTKMHHLNPALTVLPTRRGLPQQNRLNPTARPAPSSRTHATD